MDSAGMAVILGAIRRMRADGGLLSLVNVSSNVMHTLTISRLVDFVPVSALGASREVTELDPSVQPLWRTTLPVDGRDLHATRARIQELCGRLPFSTDDIFDLTLAVGEAVGNAADHTCGEGILVTVSAYADRMVVEVTDCGDGFDPACIDASGMRLCEERGRGIRLMQLLVDSVGIHPRQGGTGMVVRLVKLI